MLFKIFLLFVAIPVAELYILIKVGSQLGVLPTIALVLLISMAGAWLVRHQGFEIVRRIQNELAHGRPPAAELLDGALVLVGGVMLLTPGFLTDLIGLSFLLPPTRAMIRKSVRRWLEHRLQSDTIIIHRF